MEVIYARNVNEALPRGLMFLKRYGEQQESRNGPVLVMPTPVMTVYSHPLERVLFDPIRDANPFFHYIEALWMLAGRDSVGDLTPYVKRMEEFSDNGITLGGAYGARWRSAFGFDQLDKIIAELKHNPTSRRVVLTMWGPNDLRKGMSYDSFSQTLGAPSKDVPCNTQVYFWIQKGRLYATITCRSNDVIWGAYGANAVHFSYLMEYIALGVGVPVGMMYQLSNNYHVYSEREDVKKLLERADDVWYAAENLTYPPLASHAPIIQSTREVFDRDVQLFFERTDMEYFAEPTIQHVALPMRRSHEAYRKGDWTQAIHQAGMICDLPWREACLLWLQRRQTAAEAKQGPCSGGAK